MISRTWQHFRFEYDRANVLTVWIDVADRTMNVFNSDVILELEEVVDQLETESVTAVVFRSAKASGFFAGADVKQIADLKSPEEIRAVVARGQALFARIEALQIPTVAAIHGPCLGGGLEFALACRHRIALDVSATRLGLPEVQLGLIPAWGGTQRLSRLIGLPTALSMILKGKRLTAAAALRAGLVDAISSETSWETFPSEFARDPAAGRKPVRRSLKQRIVRELLDTVLGRWFVLRAAERQIRRDAENYPALPAALRAVTAAFDTDLNGFEVEQTEFTALIETSACRNLLKLFFWRERARSYGLEAPPEAAAGRGSTRMTSPPPLVTPSTPPPMVADERRDNLVVPTSAEADHSIVRTIGIIGAGAMGAGIGQLAALKGFRVVLKELTPALAEAGLERVTGLLNDMVEKRRLSLKERDEVLQRISASDQFDALADCDLVIEAVVERMDVKRKVFAELDAVLKPHAIIATNTSALSVTEMAAATGRPDKVAGLHFFNPVHRMDLVEVVRTADSSAGTINSLLKLLKKLGKTPIVTSDSPGFLVNRVLFPYIGEAVRMVLEGRDCTTLDREVKRFGMPMGPIELIDHVGLDVAWHVAGTLEHVLPESEDVLRLLGQMVARGWTGRKGGRGFYEYRDGRRRGVNADIQKVVADTGSAPQAGATPDEAVRAEPAHAMETAEDRGLAEQVETECMHPNVGAFLQDNLSEIQRRLIYPMINEAGFCMQEGVVAEPWMVDLAMILGTGFAPFRGGPLTLAEQIGRQTLLNNLHVLSARHGTRFKPSAWLVENRTDPRDVDDRRHVTT
ncbi:MAG: 3-hydroxyacyl-CoA dehydrogenase NAD-binding domain-containing protein [Fuerstiella sp.]